MTAPISRLKRIRRVVVGALAGAAVVTAATLGAIHMMAPRNGQQTFTDMRGNTVALDVGAGLTPAVRAGMHATADAGARFQAPSVGLNVPLGALDESDGIITPPGFRSAYLVRNLGVPPDQASRGTVFVAMHSLRDGGVGPGNYLIDVAHQKARVAAGDPIVVDGVHYTVTGTRSIGKGAISRDRDIWADTPDRLVIITCLQRPGGGPSRDNMVITGALDE